MRSPKPEPNETQADFAIRFHEAMAEAIPSTDDREAEAVKAWGKGNGTDTLDRVAKQRFGRDFRHVPRVSVFSEHATTRKRKNAAGEDVEEPVEYDRDALAAIANRCNERIADTGDFAPITDGHTPSKEGGKQPPVLGFAGPFRLGMIGNVNPRWAIFEDEWHANEHADRLRDLPRRSPEVWMEERVEDRFLDPIAALGAETPRLDMGMTQHYAKTADGRQVEKYVATFAGPANVFVPSASATGGEKRKQKYECDCSETPDVTQFTDDSLRQLTEALFETAPFQFLLDLMEQGPKRTPKEKQMDDELLEQDEFGAGLEPEADPGMPLEPAPEPADVDINVDADGDDAEMMSRYMAGEVGPEEMEAYKARKRAKKARRYSCEDEDREMLGRYAAGEVEDDDVAEYFGAKYSAAASVADLDVPASGDVADEAKYSRRASRRRRGRQAEAEKYAKMERQNREMRSRIQRIENDRTHAERYSRVTELRAEGFPIDDADAEEWCDPAKTSDDQFNRHTLSVQKYAAKVPLASRVPELYVAKDEETERSMPTAREADEAKKYALREHDKGREITFHEALDEVRKNKTATA